MTACTPTSNLMIGELIEIKYRISRLAVNGTTPDFTERWISARIVHNDNDAPPMARLADGQLTDIRAYMTWRRIPGSEAAFVGPLRG
ncbi:MAG: hypothetical protein WC026_03895 [Hyphomicrobium sp.]|uniref:hypothetical protein n=1 Tax=Hyphomicrobium sp. TaxID=82 RepID=UPI003566D679